MQIPIQPLLNERQACAFGVHEAVFIDRVAVPEGLAMGGGIFDRFFVGLFRVGFRCPDPNLVLQLG